MDALMKAMNMCVRLLQYLVQVTILLVQSDLKVHQMIWAVHILYDDVRIPSAPLFSPISSELHLAASSILLLYLPLSLFFIHSMELLQLCIFL